MRDADIAGLVIDSARDVDFLGDFRTLAAVDVDTGITGTINVGDGAGADESIQAGGVVSLSGVNVDIDGALVSGAGLDANGNSVDVTTSGGNVVELNGTVIGVNGVRFQEDVIVDGDSTVTSTGGAVTFMQSLDARFGTETLTVNAVSGTARFTGAVANTTNSLVVLTVNADIADFDSTVTLGSGGLDVNANEAQLANNIATNEGIVDFTGTDLVVLTGSVDIDTDAVDGAGTAGNILFGPDSLVTDGANTFVLSLDANSVTLGDIDLGTVNVGTLRVDAADTVTLYDNVETTTTLVLDNADEIEVADAAQLISGGAVSVATDVQGNNTLGIVAGGNVTLGAAGPTQMTELTGLTVSGTSVDFVGSVDIPGSIQVTVTDADAAAIDIRQAVTSSEGGIVLTATSAAGGTELDGNVTARQDVVINSLLSGVNAARQVQSQAGDIVVGGTIGGNQGITLDAELGNVRIQDVNKTGALAINADTALLDGSTVTVTAPLDLTTVGLTTLGQDVTITVDRQ